MFTETLKKIGFQLYRYNSCVANIVIKGKPCMIGWWVDDNFISHKKPKVVGEVIESIEKKFGKMSVS